MPRRLAAAVIASCTALAALGLASTGAQAARSRVVDVRSRVAGRTPSPPPQAGKAIRRLELPLVRHVGSLEARAPQLDRTVTPARATATAAAGARTPTIDPALDMDTLGQNLATTPADPTGALGTAFVVAAVNVQVAVYDRTTATPVAGPVRLRGISSAMAGLQETDPKVYYDPYDDVFVLAFLVYDNTVGKVEIVTIPAATADDMGTWCRTEMNGDQVSGGGKQFADYPTIGFTSNRVTLATNNFDFATLSKFQYSQVVSMKKSQLYDDPTCTKTVHIDVLSGADTRNPDGTKAFTLQPAMSIGGTPTDQYLVSAEKVRGTNALVLWRLRFVSGTPKLTKVALPVKAFQLPPYGRQCGSTSNPNTWWDTGDLRLMNAWFDGGHVYTAHAVAANPGGGVPESAIRWYDVATAGTLSASTVARTGTIGAAGHDAAWGSVATSADGTLFVDYSRAGQDECLSIYAGAVPAGATSATRARLVQGTARFEFIGPSATDPGIERWGDYSAINRDPLDGTAMALFNAYAIDDGGPSPTSQWQARVTLVRDA